MIPLDPIQSLRELRHIPLWPLGTPMPLEPSQIPILRGILYSLENPKPMSERVRRDHVDALKRCIAELEAGSPQTPLWWAAGALRKSMKQVSPNLYIATDRNLQTWALDQIFELIPEDEREH
jgi:hypothetical protein